MFQHCKFPQFAVNSQCECTRVLRWVTWLSNSSFTMVVLWWNLPDTFRSAFGKVSSKLFGKTKIFVHLWTSNWIHNWLHVQKIFLLNTTLVTITKRELKKLIIECRQLFLSLSCKNASVIADALLPMNLKICIKFIHQEMFDTWAVNCKMFFFSQIWGWWILCSVSWLFSIFQSRKNKRSRWQQKMYKKATVFCLLIKAY